LLLIKSKVQVYLLFTLLGYTYPVFSELGRENWWQTRGRWICAGSVVKQRLCRNGWNWSFRGFPNSHPVYSHQNFRFPASSAIQFSFIFSMLNLSGVSEVL